MPVSEQGESALTGLWKADMRLGRKLETRKPRLALADASVRPRRARLSDEDRAELHAELEVIWLRCTQKEHREVLRDKHWMYG